MNSGVAFGFGMRKICRGTPRIDGVSNAKPYQTAIPSLSKEETQSEVFQSVKFGRRKLFALVAAAGSLLIGCSSEKQLHNVEARNEYRTATVVKDDHGDENFLTAKIDNGIDGIFDAGEEILVHKNGMTTDFHPGDSIDLSVAYSVRDGKPSITANHGIFSPVAFLERRKTKPTQ